MRRGFEEIIKNYKKMGRRIANDKFERALRTYSYHPLPLNDSPIYLLSLPL